LQVLAYLDDRKIRNNNGNSNFLSKQIQFVDS